MLLIKRSLSVLLCLFTCLMVIPLGKFALITGVYFMGGKTQEGLSSSISTVLLFLICLVVLKVARSIWTDPRVAAQALPAQMPHSTDPFGHSSPAMVQDTAPAFGTHPYSAGDR